MRKKVEFVCKNCHAYRYNIVETPIKKRKNMKKNLVWANRYGRTGELMSSTPFQSFEDAISNTEEVVGMVNQVMPDKLQYNRTSIFQWEDERGSVIRIEQTGSPFLYVRDEWIAISANYTEYIPRDEWFINLLLGWFGINTDKLVEFADQFYAEHLERVFCEEYWEEIKNQ